MSPDTLLIPVESSAIVGFRYFPKRKTLRLKYVPGPVWDYAGVPPQEYEMFLAAPSKGQFVNDVIRPRHRGKQVH